MANQVGKVRFSDGTILYPVVQGSSGGVSRQLYISPDDAHQHRHDSYDLKYPKVPDVVPDEEQVEVWEWIDDDGEPTFYSYASKSLLLLTGHSSRESASHDYSQQLEVDSGFTW